MNTARRSRKFEERKSNDELNSRDRYKAATGGRGLERQTIMTRTATIARIRNLARKVAEAWLAEREALGFPLLKQP